MIDVDRQRWISKPTTRNTVIGIGTVWAVCLSILVGCGFFDGTDRTVVAIRDAVIDRAREELLSLLLPIVTDLVDDAPDAPDEDRERVLRVLAMIAELDGLTLVAEYEPAASLLRASTNAVPEPSGDFEVRREYYRALIDAALTTGELALERSR